MTEQGHARRITVNFRMYEGVAFCDVEKMVWISTIPHNCVERREQTQAYEENEGLFMHSKAGTKAR